MFFFLQTWPCSPRQNNFSEKLLDEGFISLQFICWIFLLPCIYKHGWEKFWNKWCSNYRKMHLQIKKLNLNIFTHVPSKTLPQVLIITPTQKKFTLPLPGCFFFLKICPPPVESGGGRGNYQVYQRCIREGMYDKISYFVFLLLVISLGLKKSIASTLVCNFFLEKPFHTMCWSSFQSWP